MASEIDELVDLLKQTNIRCEVKLKGLEYILGLTATDTGISTVLTENLISFMVNCLKDCPAEDQNLLPLVFKCLINVSSHKEGAVRLLSSQQDFVHLLFQRLCNSDYQHVESTCYVLNNLSSHGTFWSSESNLSISSEQLETVTKLFLSSDKEKYRFLALVFANITKHAEIRKYFLENNNYLGCLFSICVNPSESVIRRLGISFTLRNCCSETDFHEKLLQEINVLPYLLLPLMGPEDYKEEEMDKLPIDCQYLESDKAREEHPKIRRALVQALCLLCYSEEGWNYLKDNGVFFATRELHNWEKDESVIEAIETLLVYLLVENYKPLNAEGKSTILDSCYVLPSETDIVKDLPDFFI